MLRFLFAFFAVMSLFIAQNVGSYWILAKSSRSYKLLSEDERKYEVRGDIPLRRQVGFPGIFWRISPQWSKGILASIETDFNGFILGLNVAIALVVSYFAGRWLKRRGERRMYIWIVRRMRKLVEINDMLE